MSANHLVDIEEWFCCQVTSLYNCCSAVSLIRHSSPVDEFQKSVQGKGPSKIKKFFGTGSGGGGGVGGGTKKKTLGIELMRCLGEKTAFTVTS